MRKGFHIFLIIAADFIAAVAAWILFYILRKYILHEIQEGISFFLIGSAIMIAIFWVLFYAFCGFYVRIFRKSRIKEILNLVWASFLGVMIIFFLLLLDDEGVINYTQYYKTVSTYFILHVGITAILKLALLTYIKNLIKKGKIWFNTLLIGSNKNAREIYEELQNSKYSIGFRIVGYVHVFENTSRLLEDKLRHFGDYKRLESVIRRCEIEQVIIAIEPSEHEKIQEVLSLVEGYSARISIIPDLYQILIGSVKISHMLGTPLIEINQDLMPVWQIVIKRTIDIVTSLLVLTLGFPFLATIGLITKFTSKGTIFYSQERIGKDRRPFKIYKFRSMYRHAEKTGPELATMSDPRITQWGRFMRRTRIDELPQFFNVLIGNMSLVGPRPERQYFIEKIEKQAPYYKHLHRVLPGITSLGQVKFGYAENVDEMIKRLKYDILYIENMSLAMDFRIFLYTIMIVFQGRGK
ncbi:MAG: sugar transferase [Cytophagales bacterium]|nr:sugar transferase [Cytophagales bacterium]